MGRIKRRKQQLTAARSKRFCESKFFLFLFFVCFLSNIPETKYTSFIAPCPGLGHTVDQVRIDKKKRNNFTMKRKSKADVGDINMESQGTVSPFEAVPSPESQSVVFFPGLASSPLEGQEARTSSTGQEIVSSPLDSLGAVFSLPEDVNYTPESQGAESEVRIPI